MAAWEGDGSVTRGAMSNRRWIEGGQGWKRRRRRCGRRASLQPGLQQCLTLCACLPRPHPTQPRIPRLPNGKETARVCCGRRAHSAPPTAPRPTCVDVEDGAAEALGHVRAVGRGAAVLGVRREGNLTGGAGRGRGGGGGREGSRTRGGYPCSCSARMQLSPSGPVLELLTTHSPPPLFHHRHPLVRGGEGMALLR